MDIIQRGRKTMSGDKVMFEEKIPKTKKTKEPKQDKFKDYSQTHHSEINTLNQRETFWGKK